MAVATVAAIVAGVAALAGAGTAYHSDRSGRRAAKDAARDQKNEAITQTQKLEGEKETIAKTEEMRLARARQIAMQGGVGGYRSTINTSPLGLSSNATGKQKIGD